MVGKFVNSLRFSSLAITANGEVQFTSALCGIGSSGGHEGRSSEEPLPVFSAGGLCEQFWHGQGCPLFDDFHPTFPLPTTASPILPDALKDDFGEAVAANHASFRLLTVAKRCSG